jgi:hypothetical protein
MFGERILRTIPQERMDDREEGPRNQTDSKERPMGSPGHQRRPFLPWQVSFLLLAAIWGFSFWRIKLGLQMLAPVQMAFVRLRRRSYGAGRSFGHHRS